MSMSKQPVIPDVLLADRKAARLAGHRFYQGRTCPLGHSGKRYVSKGQCHDCQMAGSKARPVGAGGEARRAWKQANPDKVRADKRRYRALLQGAQIDANVTADYLDVLLRAQGGCCAYCGSPDSISLDHKIPLSRGGAHSTGNLQFLCMPCNSHKGAQTDVEYRERQFILDHTPWDGL